MLRRSFLSRFTAGAALFGAAGAETVRASRWEAATHPQDDWFDQVPGKHRVCFDTWMADPFPDAVRFAGNYMKVNKDVYDLSDRDIALVIVVRHKTAPFAFTDAMWAKYGKAFSDRMMFTDPKTHQVPSTNIYAGELGDLVREGVHFAVCNLTTRAYSKIIADQSRTSEDAVYKELTGNTIGNCHFVPAGIVAVTRAQEHGYALVSIG